MSAILIIRDAYEQPRADVPLLLRGLPRDPFCLYCFPREVGVSFCEVRGHPDDPFRTDADGSFQVWMERDCRAEIHLDITDDHPWFVAGSNGGFIVDRVRLTSDSADPPGTIELIYICFAATFIVSSTEAISDARAEKLDASRPRCSTVPGYIPWIGEPQADGSWKIFVPPGRYRLKVTTAGETVGSPAWTVDEFEEVRYALSP